MTKKLLRLFQSEKFIIIVVITILVAICLISVSDNMRRKTFYFVCQYDYDKEFLHPEKVVTKKVQIMSLKGKSETYVYFDELEKEEIVEKYEELYDADAYRDKRWSDSFKSRWRKTQEVLYDEKIREYLDTHS